MNAQAIGAAIEHILLRAVDFGLGSLWLGDILSEEDFISSLYPDMGKLVAGIVLGYAQPYTLTIQSNNHPDHQIGDF